jgi:alcohol dehydrogenase class IV
VNTGAFVLARTPRIVFGAGSIDGIGKIAAGYGKRALLILSRSVKYHEGKLKRIIATLDAAAVEVLFQEFHGEPSPDFVDSTVDQHSASEAASVIAIGGGSAIDVGKAISAMLPLGGSVAGYLEEVGNKHHPGCKVPFIAVPTTAGTGSEASANAVLSRIGGQGFKKSLRHENLVPNIALVDPELALSCPAEVTAACGMDALTQLLEAYVSPKASAMTDALVESALPKIRECLEPAVHNGKTNLAARSGMAYAALISGIALANAGLGIVHGLASPIGGLFHIPHGVVCGSLLLPAVAVTIRELQRNDPTSPALEKYAKAGAILTENQGNGENGIESLVRTITRLTDTLRMPRLSAYGIRKNDIASIVSGAANKNNPARLTKEQIAEILFSRL